MFRLTLKGAVAHKLRFLSTVMAVLLGVAFMAGTLVLTDTLTRTFDDVLTEANQGVDALVRVPSAVDIGYGESRERFDSGVAEDLAAVPGVADLALRISGYSQLVGPDGSPAGDQAQAPAFGLNWVGVDELNPYRLTEGTAPTADDEIVIDRGTAAETGYRPGDVVTVLTSHEPARFTISGVASFGSADSPAGATVVLYTDATAQRLLSSPGRVDGIAVTATGGTSRTELAERLALVVDDSLEVVTGDTVVAEGRAAFDAGFGPFKTFMLVFAFIAVFVGAFIINNTFSITVAQRSREMAMLRAIGASRRQVLRSVLLEATLTGVVASAAGLVVGLAVATGLEALLAGFGVDLPDGPTVVSGSAMAIPFVIGVAVTVVSAWLPARRASRIPPIAAIREVAVDRSGSSVRRPLIGVLVTAAGVIALVAGLDGAGIVLVGLGALVVLVGVAVLGPVIATPVTRLLGAPLGLRGIAGEMASRNALRDPKRTARTASSLTIGVALVAFIAVFSASFRSSFSSAVDVDFHGTHVIDSGVFDSSGGISPELADSLRASPEIELVSEYRIAPAAVDGAPTDASAFDADAIGQLFDLGTVEGDLSGLGADGMAVHVDRADDEGWTLGSVVPVDFASGPAEFEVRAIYGDSTWVGSLFFDVAGFDANVGDQLDSRVYVAGDGSVITSLAEPYPTADVLDKDGFVRLVNGDIDQILGIVYVLLAMAVIIALLGIANTLALSVFERTRELGLLRAVGMGRGQVRSTIRWEAVLIALFGTVLGLAVGTFFGWATVRALAEQGIDTFTVPVTSLVVVTLVAGTAGMVAAALPARRAARLDVLEALATH